jgi:TRAP-type transport system small permease protein
VSGSKPNAGDAALSVRADPLGGTPADPLRGTHADPLGGPPVMGADGQFHMADDAVSFADTPWEAWAALVLFALLGGTVFTQFFTRYVLNDSAAWTEEIARYLLIGTVFVGAAIGVARNNHIQVDFFYRYMPRVLARIMATGVDVLRTGFYAAACVLMVLMMQRLGNNSRMTMVDLPMNVVYAVVLMGFAAMTVRSCWVSWVHWQRGYTVLEKPESTMAERG